MPGAPCLILVHRLRFWEATIAFATDTELSLYVRMTDWTGAPGDNKTLIWSYMSPDLVTWRRSGPMLAPSTAACVPAPLYADGWYGAKYSGFLPSARLSVSISHSTTVDRVVGPNKTVGAIDPVALALVGAVPVGQGAAPYLQLQLEAPFSACPWRAAYGSQIALAYEVTIEGDLSYLRPARDGVECHRVLRVGARPARRLVGLAAARGRADARPHHRGGELPAGLRRQFPGVKGGGSIWLCNLTVIRDERAPPSCVSDPADAVAAWPAARYYTGAGAFLPLPGHVSPGYDCFGDACDAGPNAPAAAPAVRVRARAGGRAGARQHPTDRHDR